MSSIPLAPLADPFDPTLVDVPPRPAAAGVSAAAEAARAEAAAATERAAAAGRALAAVDVVVPPVKVPAAYGLTMSLLAACLVLLSVGYLALVGFLGWLVAWHAVQTFASLEYGPYFVFHVPMAVLGGLLLLFLVKPVFFRQKATDEDVIVLRPADEPTLFAFVRRLCAATGTRVPVRIEVDCDPNASARVSGGLRSLLGGGLVLRVGLPLVAAMSVRQFAGVLGHEFGHFNQRSGMTGSYLIRRLTGFFAAVVFRRDRLDERLAKLRHSNNAFARLAYWVAAALVEPMRGVLWLMLVAGHLLTCSVLRRMEYDADHVEANLAGVRDFTRTNQLMVFLGIAARRARHDLADAFEEKRLADDLPALIAANARQLAEHRDDILKLVEAERTSWFDTHPSHADRVRNVERAGPPGLVELEAAAETLWADFPGVCRRSTEAFYRGVLGEKDWAEAKTSSKLVTTAEIAEDRAGQRVASKALRRFYRNRMVTTRPIFPAPEAATAAADVAAATAALSAARAEMLALADGMATVVDAYDEAVGALPAARAQLELCGLFSFNPKVNPLRKKAKALQAAHEPVLIRASRQLAAFEDPAQRRLTAALQLLRRDDVLARLPGSFADDGTPVPSPDPRATVLALVWLCQELHGAMPKVERLRESVVRIGTFFSAYNADLPYGPLVDRIIAADNKAIDALRELQQELQGVAYPFAHGTADVSVGTALVPQVPKNDDPVEVHGAGGGTLDRYYSLVFRTLATLTEWAEKVEVAVGLDPLGEPPEREDKPDPKELAKAKRAGLWHRIGLGARAVSGLGLVAGIVWFSVAPPNLPEMPWEERGAAADRWRPASFNSSVRGYTVYQPTPPSAYPNTWQSRPGPGGYPAYPAGGPNRGPYAPGTPNGPGGPYGPSNPSAPANPYAPGRPNRPPPGGPPQPYRPGPSYNPRPGSPSSGGGGYSPNRGGGGGYSPGGGGGRGR